MPPLDDSQDIMIANTTITLNNTGDLLTALARCVNKFREINQNFDEFTTHLLSHLDTLIATKSVEFFSSYSATDKSNGSQTRNTNSEISSDSSDNEPREDAVSGLHRELSNQNQQDPLSWRTKRVAEQDDHELLDEQTEQSAVANPPTDAPRPEINTNADPRELPESENILCVRQTNDHGTEATGKQITRRGPRIKYIKKRKAEKESHELRQKGASEILEGVTSRPTVDVESIYQRFTNLQSNINTAYDDTRILTLMRLFYAIASPDAICQLRDACQSLRNGTIQVTESTENLSSTVRALDRLDASDHVASITRRYYLVALSAKRYEFRTDLSKNSDHSRTRVIQETSDEVFGRNDALVLTEMMVEAYPQLKPTRFRNTKGKDEYGKKLKTLKDRLVSGQKWSKLSEEFASGILALVPTQGEYHVSNRDFERLPVDAIDTLIKILNEYRRDFLRQVSISVSANALNFLRGNRYGGKFSFEDADAGFLRTEKYDSPSLIELCKVGDSQPDPNE